MELTDAVSAGLLVITAAVMLSAAYSDWKTREVSDIHWAIIGFSGIAGNTFCYILNGFCSGAFVFVISGTLFMCSILCLSGRSGLLCESIAFAISAAMMFADPGSYAVYTSPCLFGGLYHLFYQFGIIRGGADAKCLIALGFAIPIYPISLLTGIQHVPDLLTMLFPPSFAVLFVSSVLSVAGCSVFCVSRNLKAGLSLGRMIRMYPVSLAEAENSFVWPAERIVCTERTFCGDVDDSEADRILKEFRDAGEREIYVTPMIPFIVPAFLSVIILLLIGNPLFAI